MTEANPEKVVKGVPMGSSRTTSGGSGGEGGGGAGNGNGGGSGGAGGKGGDGGFRGRKVTTCSFCGKTSREVGPMVEGPNEVCICRANCHFLQFFLRLFCQSCRCI